MMGHGEVVILHNDADIFRNCMRQGKFTTDH